MRLAGAERGTLQVYNVIQAQGSPRIIFHLQRFFVFTNPAFYKAVFVGTRLSYILRFLSIGQVFIWEGTVILLGISARQTRDLLTGWVKDGWLVVADPSRRGRKYSLAEE
ncbi:MAG: hypothetical protein U5K99_10695 [Anaerolineales bacterium]|nr:hypothetical protein [Anaerolineales bacterium]